jgi:hypothetical protein
MNAELHKLIRTAIKTGDAKTMTTTFASNAEAATMNTPFGSWLHVAASFGQLGIVRMLVEDYGLDVNQRGGTSDSSPLDRACADGQYDVVKYLLEHGAKVDISAPERNPLFGAILSGNVEIAKLLIEHGIDTTVKYTGESMHEMSARDFARERGAEEFVSLLGG